MKRIALLGPVLAGLLVFAPVPAGAGVGPASDVYVVHGIGTDLTVEPPQNPVDVYFKTQAATEWDLLLDEFVFGEIAGPVPVSEGDYNVLLCTSDDVADPLDTITACQDNGTSNAVNSNAGSAVSVPAGENNITLVASFGLERPTVVPFVNDVTCVQPAASARLAGLHAAQAQTATVTANGATAGTLDFGDSFDVDVPAFPPNRYDLGVSDGAALLLNIDDFEPAPDTLTNLIVVGSPNGYSAIAQEIPLAVCEQPTTTTTTTTAPPPTTATPRPVAATPRYTG
ncbi:MAG: hypothetical protein MUF83_06755 [Acidimicrobiales bacterium]|jgi:hypothetical protein|nr:hypothetical protein [Acidimicrobiales bacterium]